MDPIADMLVRIKSAMRVKKESLEIPFSKMKEEIARLLKEECFIEKYEVLNRGKKSILRIQIKYTSDGKSVISGLKRISKPGRRVYANQDSIPLVLGGFGVSLLSTSKGILSDAQARAAKVGGEILFNVW